MTKNLNFHVAIMLVIAVAINYVFSGAISATESSKTYSMGFILGRSFANVLVPLFLVFLVMLPFRWGKKKFTKGPLVAYWVLFSVLTLMATIGSMLPQSA